MACQEREGKCRGRAVLRAGLSLRRSNQLCTYRGIIEGSFLLGSSLWNVEADRHGCSA